MVEIPDLKVSRRGKISVENNVVVVKNGSYNSSHSSTSMLKLNSTTTLESLRLRVLKPSKRILSSKGLSYTKLDR